MSLIDKFADVLTDEAVKAKNATSEEAEEIRYVTVRFLRMAIFVIALVVLSGVAALFLDVTWKVYLLSIGVVLFSFSLMRRCWGGSHVESDVWCIILSTAVMLFVPATSFFIRIGFWTVLIFYLLSFLTLSLTGAADSRHRPYSERKKAMFKRQGYITLGILFVLNMWTSTIKGEQWICSAVFLGVLLSVVDIAIVKIKSIYMNVAMKN